MRLPRDWVSLAPNGIGHQKPNHYKEMVKVAWKVKGNRRKAWRILSEGVCDGCALGVAGFHDWTLDGVHLCTTRLRLLEVNCAEPFDHTVLARRRRGCGTSARPSCASSAGSPTRCAAGAVSAGFRRITWDEAMGAVADAIRAAGGDRTAIYLTSRGITNEVYYAAAKAARAMGVANIDSAARTCHAPSTVGLKQTIGVAASTCSMQDVLDTDLDRAVGHERRQQPAGVHEVPVPRAQARRPRRRRQPVPRARPGALLGAVERRVGAVRHQAVRPPRAGPAGGRRRLRQRGAAASSSPATPSTTSGSPPTPRAGTTSSPTSARSIATRCSNRPASTSATLERVRRPVRRRPRRGARVEHGHHAAHPRRRRRAGDRQRRPRPRQRRARRRRADADPRPLRRAGRRRDGRLRDGVPRRRAGRRRARRGLGASAGASTFAATSG